MRTRSSIQSEQNPAKETPKPAAAEQQDVEVPKHDTAEKGLKQDATPAVEAGSEEQAEHSEQADDEAGHEKPVGKEKAGVDTAQERQDRFKALRARAKNAAERNLKDTSAEAKRMAVNPTLLSSVARKHAFASHNLLKADTEATGDDFERKRAWDWTVDESEKWDRRMEKKQRHRDDNAFQDYRQDARKVYTRQVDRMAPDLEAYEKAKIAAVEKAAASGGLEIVEAEDGELVAIDKNGTFYATAESTDFTGNKPPRAAIDRLVADLRKTEEHRLKRRKQREGTEDGEDVTFINDKNKKFNQQLSRFYNKYTAEIRESFERGTMI